MERHLEARLLCLPDSNDCPLSVFIFSAIPVVFPNGRLETKVNGNSLQHRDGRGRDGLREESLLDLKSAFLLKISDQSRLRQTLLTVPVTCNVAKCAAQRSMQGSATLLQGIFAIS